MLVEGTVSGRPWRLRAVDPLRAAAIAQRHGLPEVLGRILAGRGLAPEAVPAFLEPRLKDVLPDPSHLVDLDRVAARLAEAVVEGERIGIVGDYDVDGATSTALAARWLKELGIVPVIAIPDRLVDGYGASAAILARLATEGCRLVLTLDNGTSAFDALTFAAAQGQEVIVVDHHAAEARLPLLGVCLGHQAIGEAFGGRVVRCHEIVHGKPGIIAHRGEGVFAGLPSPFSATRYHSLIVERETLPDCLSVTAWLADGTIMGLRHRSLPIEGVQFHPESIASEHGHALLRNFLRLVAVPA